MSQIVDVTYIGFVIGKYTYFGYNKSLCRRLTNNPRGKVIKHKIQLHGGSLGYNVGGNFVKEYVLSKMKTKVVLKELVPF